MKKNQALYLFDLDGTLLKENVSFSFGKYLLKEGRLPFLKMFYLLFLYLCHKQGLLSLSDLQKKIFKSYFQGQSFDNLSADVNRFLSQSLHKLMYFPAIEIMEKALESSHKVVILSSSPSFLVNPIAKLLKVDQSYASCYAIDKDRKLCHIETIIHGETKASLLNELAMRFTVPKSQIFAFSDSHLDLPFLEAAGVAIGVNPDSKLLKVCLKNQWKII